MKPDSRVVVRDDDVFVCVSMRGEDVVANSTKKIKIPNACIGLGVKCVNPYEMLRTERARFGLGPQP